MHTVRRFALIALRLPIALAAVAVLGVLYLVSCIVALCIVRPVVCVAAFVGAQLIEAQDRRIEAVYAQRAIDAARYED